MGCSSLKTPVETHKMIFRVCPACSELEPSLILGELEAGVKRQGEGKKGVCAWYCLSRAFCFVMLGCWGGGRLGTAGHKVLPVSQGPSQSPGCAVAG